MGNGYEIEATESGMQLELLSIKRILTCPLFFPDVSPDMR